MIGKQARSVSSIKQKVLSQLNLGGKKDSANRRRFKALFFVWVILFQTIIATPFGLAAQPAVAQGISSGKTKDDDTAQLNPNFQDSRARGKNQQRQPEAIKPKPAGYDAQIADYKSNPLGKVDESVKSQAPKLNESKPSVTDTKLKREKPERRSVYSSTFETEDGHEVEKTNLLPRNFQDEKGQWQKIEYESHEDESYAARTKRDAGLWQKIVDTVTFSNSQPRSYRNDAGQLKADFQTLSVGGVQYRTELGNFAINPDGAGVVHPQYLKDKNNLPYIKYQNVWDGVDIVYEYYGSSIKQYTILRKLPKSNQLRFKLEGARVRNVDGHVELEEKYAGKYKLADVSMRAGKNGEITNPPLRQYASDDGSAIIYEIDQGWLGQQGKDSYPIVIDPEVVSNYLPGGIGGSYSVYKSDGYVGSSANHRVNVGGINDHGLKGWRSIVHLPYNQLTPDKKLISAAVGMAMMTNPEWWHGYTESRSIFANWASCYGYHCVGDPGADNSIAGPVSTSGRIDVTRLFQNYADAAKAGNGYGALTMLRGEDWWAYNWKELDPRTIVLITQTNRMPSQVSPELPGTDPSVEQVITTANPQLRVSGSSDPDGDQVNYSFMIYSQAGQLLWQSGRSLSRSVVVPDDVLEDGSSYSWKAMVDDAISYQPVVDGGKLKLNLRQGKDKTQTYDQLGPISANLATGNVTTALGTHSISALGGNIGLNLSYNSPLTSKQGLTGEYFNNTNWSGNPVYRRTDPNINFNWDGGSGVPGVTGNDNFSVKWSGYFVAPYDGDFTFSGDADDYQKVVVNGQTVVEQSCCPGYKVSASPISLKAGQVVPLQFYFFEIGGGAAVSLRVRSNVEPAEKIVPSEWLRSAPSKIKTTTGLVGHYYFDDGSHDFSKNTSQFAVRTDAQINFNWGTGSPTPNGPGEKFLVRWEGYFTAPTTGSYKFGTGSDDGSRLNVAGVQEVDRWTTAGNGDVYGTAMSLTAGQTVPVRMEYFEQGGDASARLLWDGPNGSGPIPSTYLSTGPQLVPAGWNISADADGNLAFERISLRQNGDVAVFDADGSERVFTNTGSGYKPPVNSAAMLVVNDDGSYTLTDSDGRTYVFNPDGSLKLTTTPPDDRKPAALQYEYSAQNGVPKLKRIVDGVDSARYGELIYAGEFGCPAVAAGFDSAPAGYLCGFKTYDGQTTELQYKAGQLARITTPGGSSQDLGYDSNAMLASLRDSAANDAVAAGVRPNDSSVTTELGYDQLARVNSVTGVRPQDGLARPNHTIDYLVGASRQHISGAPEPAGYIQSIEYDSLLRTTKACDNRGQCSAAEWHSQKDLLLSTTDARGYKSTTIYDNNDIATDQYGPAPAERYGADRKPTGLHGLSTPHTASRYDEGIVGPAVAYYDYRKITTSTGDSGVLFGAPKIHTTGINASQGVVSQNWANPPVEIGAGQDGWGMAATGTLSFPASGNYELSLTSNDGVRLWLDDKKAIDDWKAGAVRSRSYTLAAEAGKSYRFRLDSFDITDSTPASLSLKIAAPGKAASDNLASYLKPAYYLKTSSTTYDYQAGNITAKINYTNPALGLATSTTVDPAGLNLTSKASYEAPGSGYLRQTSKSLPTGYDYKYNYYGATETADDPCTIMPEGYRQAGRLKGKTSPAGVTSTMIYDDAGRVVAARTNADPWSCTSYDARGRAVKVVIPTMGTKVGRTTETFYGYGNNPLVTAINDTQGGLTINETDLVGRTTRQVDGYLNETITTYNDLGQITKRTSPLGTEEFNYDNYGSISRQTLDGVEYAKPSYDSYGRILAVDYLQARSAAGYTTKLRQVKYDGLGRNNGMWLTLPDNTGISTTDYFTQSNRLVSSKLAYAGKLTSSDYSYDGAGRLTQATVDNWKFNYSFGAQDGSCASYGNNNPNSGSNGNRTSYTVLNTVNNQSTTTTNCYSNNDRLLNSSDAQVGKPTHDNHGNIVKLAGDGKEIIINYDASDRNSSIVQGNYKIIYSRDVAGNIIGKKEYTDGKLSAAYRYYAGGNVVANCSLTNTTQCSIAERKLSLPGNVMLTLRTDQPNPELTTTYTVKNNKGEAILDITSNGKPIGTVNLYDPFGGQLYSNTFNKAEDIVVSSTPHISLGIAQYGKRLYVASLGRFLQADPIEGGTDNDYAYVNDPVNSNDFSGEWGWSNITSWVSNAVHSVVKFVSNVVSTIVNAVVNTVKAAVNAVNNYIVRPVVNFARNTYRAAVNAIRPVINNTVQNAQKLFEAVKSKASAAAQAATQAIVEYYKLQIKLSLTIMASLAQTADDFVNIVIYSAELYSKDHMKYALLNMLMPGLGVTTQIYDDCIGGGRSDERCTNTVMIDGIMLEIVLAIVTGGTAIPEEAGIDALALRNTNLASRLDRLYKEFEKATTAEQATVNANKLLNNYYFFDAQELLSRYQYDGVMKAERLKHYIVGDANGGAHVLEAGGIRNITSLETLPTLTERSFNANIITSQGTSKMSTILPVGTTPEMAVRATSEASRNLVRGGYSTKAGVVEYRWIGRSSDGILVRFTKDPASGEITSMYNFLGRDLEYVSSTLLNPIP